MRAICISNKAAYLASDIRCLGETDETDFSPLVVGEDYIVYGLMFLRCRVDFLVCPDEAGPCWMPSQFFNVLDSALPPWSLCLSERVSGYDNLLANFGIVALIGYRDLVEDYDHYVGMLERDPRHLQRFFEKKGVMDQWVRENKGDAAN